MSHPSEISLSATASALRTGRTSPSKLLRAALERARSSTPPNGAYKLLDETFAHDQAERAEAMLDAARDGRPDPGPMCGIPVSVKDMYGVEGLPTFAGTTRRLPPKWETDAWLVSVLRAQGAVIIGKTHTVELAYSGVGINPHWGTPRNPNDASAHRIPGGSSSGAGVSLVEGSALVALGTDTGGSIRIPASLTGTVGMRGTTGNWPTQGVVPLSPTLDVVGGLTRTVDDMVWFFGSVDPRQGDPDAFRQRLDLDDATQGTVRIGVPDSDLWKGIQGDIARVFEASLGRLSAHAGSGASAFTHASSAGGLLDEAADAYLTGQMVATQCNAFLAAELPGWSDLLHPIVGDRLRDAPDAQSAEYAEALALQGALAARADTLFEDVDILALPGHTISPPPVETLAGPDEYRAVNTTLLRVTAPASFLGLPAITLPVGHDDLGLPVGLQLIAPAGQDERLLAIARRAERKLTQKGRSRN